MRRPLCIVAYTLTAFLLSACDSVLQGKADLQEQLQAIKDETASVKAEMKSVKREVEDLKEKQSAEEVRELIRSLEGIAFLRPGDDGYSLIHFDLGVLTVQLADVKPYASGSKVTLKFGNPLSAAVDGLKATIEWGKLDEKGAPINETSKSKEVTFSETLRAGAWTTVSIVLDGLPPAELGFVRVKDVAHTGIRLVTR